MKQTIMILGGSFSYLGCIQAAKEMDLNVVVADRDPNALGFALADRKVLSDISDPEACLKEAREQKIDGIVAVNDFGVLTASIVAESLGLPGLPLSVAKIATNKFLMRDAWKRYGAPTVNYAKVSSPDELAFVAKEIGFPLILKPCDSRGGGCRGIMAIDQETNIKDAFEWSNSFYKDGNLIVEEQVFGLEHSIEAIIYKGKAHIVAISDKVKSPLPFRVDDTILYPTSENEENIKIIEHAVQLSVEAIGMTEGVAHVELSMTDSGPVLFEIGSRCGGGAPAPLVPYLTGVEEFKEAVRIALGQAPVHLKPRWQKGCVIKFLYPEPGVVENVEIPKDIEHKPGVLSFGVFVKPGDSVLPLRTCKDRSGMVITGAENVEKALALAEETLNQVIVTTKNDIGNIE